jgi:hypothetical protein
MTTAETISMMVITIPIRTMMNTVEGDTILMMIRIGKGGKKEKADRAVENCVNMDKLGMRTSSGINS